MRRVRWEVIPAPGVFRWKVTRNGIEQRSFLFKHRAIENAVSACTFEWDVERQQSELYIKGRNGKIQDARTYGDDPPGIKG